MADRLEVFDVSQTDRDGKVIWTQMGTIERRTDGIIVCEPESMLDLLRRPTILGHDPMEWLDGWSNGYVSVKAPNAST